MDGTDVFMAVVAVIMVPIAGFVVFWRIRRLLGLAERERLPDVDD